MGPHAARKHLPAILQILHDHWSLFLAPAPSPPSPASDASRLGGPFAFLPLCLRLVTTVHAVLLLHPPSPTERQKGAAYFRVFLSQALPLLLGAIRRERLQQQTTAPTAAAAAITRPAAAAAFGAMDSPRRTQRSRTSSSSGAAAGDGEGVMMMRPVTMAVLDCLGRVRGGLFPHYKQVGAWVGPWLSSPLYLH